MQNLRSEFKCQILIVLLLATPGALGGDLPEASTVEETIQEISISEGPFSEGLYSHVRKLATSQLDAR